MKNNFLSLLLDKQILVTLAFAFLFTHGFSQKINYRDIRYSVYLLPCGAPDSFSVWTSIHNLEALDTTRISKHLNDYYTDLGICYWLLSDGVNGTYYGKAALRANRGALFHKPNDTKALWNCSLGYYHTGDCERGKYYMAQYKKYTPKKYWDADNVEQEKSLMANCE